MIIGLLTFLPNAPLRNPDTGEIFGNSPFMSSLLFIISMLFLAAGLGYGKGSGSLTGSTNVINAITKTFNGLGGLIFLMLLIAQFIAFFNYSNISRDRGHQAGRPARATPTSARCRCSSASSCWWS